MNEVGRCVELERILRFLKAHIAIETKSLRRGETLVSVSGIAEEGRRNLDIHGRASFDMADLEANLQQLEADVREASRNFDAVRSDYENLLDQLHVFEKDSRFFNAQGGAEEVEDG